MVGPEANTPEFFDTQISERWETFLSEEWDFSRRYESARLFDFVQPATILDIGCGCGFHGPELARPESVKLVHETDWSAKCIEKANEVYPHPKVERFPADYRNLDGKYDLVTSFQVIEHIPDAEEFLTACRRLSNGHVAVVTPNFDRLDNLLADMRRKPRSFVDPKHYREFTRRTLRESARRCGLEECGFFAYDLYSTSTPFLRSMNYRKRVPLGRWFPWGARVLGSIFRTV